MHDTDVLECYAFKDQEVRLRSLKLQDFSRRSKLLELSLRSLLVRYCAVFEYFRRKSDFAELTLEVFPAISSHFVVFFHSFLWVQPFSETFKMDVTHCPCAFARRNQGVSCRILFPKADSTNFALHFFHLFKVLNPFLLFSALTSPLSYFQAKSTNCLTVLLVCELSKGVIILLFNELHSCLSCWLQFWRQVFFIIVWGDRVVLVTNERRHDREGTSEISLTVSIFWLITLTFTISWIFLAKRLRFLLWLVIFSIDMRSNRLKSH